MLLFCIFLITFSMIKEAVFPAFFVLPFFVSV